MRPSAHRFRVAHQRSQTERSEVSSHGHRLTEIRSLVAGTGSPQTMAGKTLHDEDFLAATGRIIRRQAWVERKLRPTQQQVGVASETCKSVGPLFGRDAGAFRMFPYQIERSSRVRLSFEMRPWVFWVLDRDPGDGAAARALGDQGPGELRGETICGAGFKGVSGVGRQPLKEIEERDGLVLHGPAIGYIPWNFDCLGRGVCQEFGDGKLSFLAPKFDQQCGRFALTLVLINSKVSTITTAKDVWTYISQKRFICEQGLGSRFPTQPFLQFRPTVAT